MNDQLIFLLDEPRGPSQLIEIPVTIAGVGKVAIPDQQQLRNDLNQTIVLKGIRLITPEVLTFAPTLGGPTAPLTELQKIALVLYSEGWEKGQLIPLLTLNDMFTEGTGNPFRQRSTKFNNWRNVDWAKSYLQYANGTVTVGVPYNVLLDVEYVRLDKDGKEVVGPA